MIVDRCRAQNFAQKVSHPNIRVVPGWGGWWGADKAGEEIVGREVVVHSLQLIMRGLCLD